MTVLVLAYSISPIRGSEYSVGWNYVKEMSKDHDLIVIYGLAGDHLGDLHEIEGSPASAALQNVRWVGVRPNALARWLNVLNRHDVLVYTFYLAYRVWHRQVLAVAQRIVRENKVDLVHYLCPIGYREPGYLWQLGKPYLWGPIGGAQNRSAAQAFGKGVATGLKISVRNLVNTLQFRLSGRLRQALRRTDLLFSSTTEIQARLQQVHGVASIAMPENAITDEMLRHQRVVRHAGSGPVELIWIGSLIERKSLDVLLLALGRMQQRNWRLSVVGDGPLMTPCQALAVQQGIQEHIRWAGKLPRPGVEDALSKAHVHVLTSLLEGNATVIWEAMAFGIPTVAIDHFGARDTVCDRCGVKIEAGRLPDIVSELARRLDALVADPDKIEALSHGVAQCTPQFTWAARRQAWNGYYEQVLDHHAQRQQA